MNRLYMFVVGIVFTFISASAFGYENLSPTEAYEAVVYEGAYILDVRTAAEFIWVGHPDVENVVNISYKVEKRDQFIVNPRFIRDVRRFFKRNKDLQIITMCRSGKRSIAAAEALEEAGYTNVFNMVDGFEGGGKDQWGYRTINGWKNSELPGHTTMYGAGDYYGAKKPKQDDDE